MKWNLRNIKSFPNITGGMLGEKWLYGILGMEFKDG